MVISREVTATRKDTSGNIICLCKTFEWWSPRPSERVIEDIESGNYRYFVRFGWEEVDIHVVDGLYGKYLRTDPDRSDANNLDNLPDC